MKRTSDGVRARTRGLELRPPGSSKELSALLGVLAPIFGAKPEGVKEYAGLVGRENFRALRNGREIIGGLALIRMGQYFGARAVEMTGVAFVGVKPHARSGGAAGAMMEMLLGELRAEGVPISGLYPATLPLYRRAGYELSGSRFETKIALRQIEVGRREMADARKLDMREFTNSDMTAVNQVHRARCRMSAGGLERGRFHWSRIQHWRGDEAKGMVVVNPQTGEIEGYSFVIQKAEDMRFWLAGTDVAATTNAAALRLVAHFADHRSLVESVTYSGSSADVVMRALPEKAASVTLVDHWMTRMVNVKGALEARGYSPAVAARLELAVQDDVLRENSGNWVMDVGEGKAEVSRGGSGAIGITARGLAALYTGFLSAEEVEQAGQLRCGGRGGARAKALATASGVFAGPAPWMSDRY